MQSPRNISEAIKPISRSAIDRAMEAFGERYVNRILWMVVCRASGVAEGCPLEQSECSPADAEHPLQRSRAAWFV